MALIDEFVERSRQLAPDHPDVLAQRFRKGERIGPYVLLNRTDQLVSLIDLRQDRGPMGNMPWKRLFPNDLLTVEQAEDLALVLSEAHWKRKA